MKADIQPNVFPISDTDHVMHPEAFFHVALKVDDLEESLEFYENHLGAEIINRRSKAESDKLTAVNRIALSVADKRIYLFEEAPYEAAGLVDPLPAGVLHFGFVVTDIEAVCATLATAGVEFLMEPTEFGDLIISFCRDPDGNRIELLEHR